MQQAEKIVGVVKSILTHNEESGFFVARTTLPGDRETIITGFTPVLHVGEEISVLGKWETTKWGRQVKATSVSVKIPTKAEGLISYMGSGAFKGIGPKLAERIVGVLGVEALRIIREEPERLSAIPKIGPKKAQSIIEGVTLQIAVEGIMTFLHQNGMSASRAKRIYDAYGDKAVDKIRKNPYVLCQDIWGIGFSIADKMAHGLGITKNSDYRLRAGIRHVVNVMTLNGSCGAPITMVEDEAFKLLKCDAHNIPVTSLNRAIELEVSEKELIRDKAGDVDCLFQPKVYEAEKAIAYKLVKMANLPPKKLVSNIDEALLFAELDIGKELEAAQRKAVKNALENPVAVITGGPGTGKSTITQVIVSILKQNGLSYIKLTAPTGKAARRLASAAGEVASTIHKALGVRGKGGFEYNEHHQLDCDVFLIDESSMVDVALFLSILKALPYYTRVIIIGDVDQLPSVGPGKVLCDIIDSGVIPTVQLTEPFRQAKNSQIIVNAHKVNRGEMPDYGANPGSDFIFYDPGFEADKEAAAAKMVRFVRDLRKRGFDPIKDVQILAPLKKGVLGTIALNAALKEILNPDSGAFIERYDEKFSVGDKVLQKKNNYDKGVSNGDIGFIVELDAEKRTMVVDFDGNLVAYEPADLDELVLAFAITVHKSQGSEFAVVVMPMDMSHFMMLKRNLLYTGITRAKKLMVLFGTKAAVRSAIQDSQIAERYSKLREWLLAAHLSRTGSAKAA